ncbi:penicillin acylase family protein, partial [Klebsiella pneumoniae]|uniref:penicillin acylase family protein n=1 Tax=Klebsiella pneumoniae TaxID=573 RepID=UPI002AE019C6
SMALQTDATSVQSRRLVKLLRETTSRTTFVANSPDGGQQVRDAAALLSTWDSNERADSAAAAIYETWVSRHLGATAVRR